MAKPKIRFNGYTEDWEQRKLGEMCSIQVSEISNQKIDEIEFRSRLQTQQNRELLARRNLIYDRETCKQRRYLNDYYIVRNDDFVYNPRISVTAPVGPTNRNRLGRNGVSVATLYGYLELMI